MQAWCALRPRIARRMLPALPDLLRDQGRVTSLVSPDVATISTGRQTGGQRGRARDGRRCMDARQGLRTFKSNAWTTWRRVGNDETLAASSTRFLDAAPKDKPWFFWLGFSAILITSGARRDRPGSRLDPAKALKLPPHLPDLPERARRSPRVTLPRSSTSTTTCKACSMRSRRAASTENTLVVFMGDNGMAMPHGKGALHDPRHQCAAARTLARRGESPGGVTRSSWFLARTSRPRLLEVVRREAARRK